MLVHPSLGTRKEKIQLLLQLLLLLLQLLFQVLLLLLLLLLQLRLLLPITTTTTFWQRPKVYRFLNGLRVGDRVGRVELSASTRVRLPPFRDTRTRGGSTAARSPYLLLPLLLLTTYYY